MVQVGNDTSQSLGGDKAQYMCAPPGGEKEEEFNGVPALQDGGEVLQVGAQVVGGAIKVPDWSFCTSYT